MPAIELFGPATIGLGFLLYLQDSPRLNAKGKKLLLVAAGLQISAIVLLLLPADAHAELYLDTACVFTVAAGICCVVSVFLPSGPLRAHEILAQDIPA